MNTKPNTTRSPRNPNLKGAATNNGRPGTKNIPRLQVNPGTPVPENYPSTRSAVPSAAHIGLHKLSEGVQLPQIIPSNHNPQPPQYGVPRQAISAASSGVSMGNHNTCVAQSSCINAALTMAGAPSVSQSTSSLDKSIKQEFDSSYCMNAPMDTGSHDQVRHSHHGYPVGMRNQALTNQHVLSARAPSEISSIDSTPRQIMTPTDKNTTNGDNSQTFLAPGPPVTKHQSWTSYSVLPHVAPGQTLGSVAGSEAGDCQPSAMSQHSSNCLSPFIFDLSPPDSHYRGRNSKNGKRPMSTSTLSSGSIDILAMIRCSPTALHPLNGSRGSPSSGSVHYSHLAGGVMMQGAMGHLNVRNSGSSTHSSSGQQGHRGSIPRDMESVHLDDMMRFLEQTAGGGLDNLSMNSNQMVVQPDMPFLDQFYKPEYAAPAPAISGQVPQQAMCHESEYDKTIPPPPPYPTTLAPPQQQQQPQKQPTYDTMSSAASVQESTSSEKPEEGDGPENFICKWIDCNLTFLGRSEMVQHIEKVHIDQRRGDDFTCYWQGCVRRYRPFNARYKLLIHMRVHSGEKPNKCTFENCDKAFSRLENLKIHLRSHTGERPYQCTQAGCSKAFSNSSDRAKHQRTHVDTKPYACQVPGCVKRYTDPSSLRKHVKSHDSKDQHARKKVRHDEFMAPRDINNCLSVHQVRNNVNGSPMDHQQHLSTEMYPGMQFGPGTILSPAPGMTEGQHIHSSMGHLEGYEHRRVGAGFNGALVGPGRRTTSQGQRRGINAGPALPTLHGTKLGPNMGGNMPPPPPYPQEPSPHDPQWQQSPGQPVATSTPHETVPALSQAPSPQVALQALGGESAMPSVQQTSSYTQLSPRPYMPPNNYQTSLQMSPPQPPTHHHQRLHHVNYMPQEGNAPLVNDYAGMPCNLQERMTGGQPNAHAFHMQMTTLEDTLANLPYDAIQLQRALPNHSGV